MIQTADICDVFRSEARPLKPEFRSFGGKDSVNGLVKTITTSGNVVEIVDILRSPGAQRLIMIDASSVGYYAMLGDAMAAIAVENEWQDIIINGYVGDAKNTD